MLKTPKKKDNTREKLLIRKKNLRELVLFGIPLEVAADMLTLNYFTAGRIVRGVVKSNRLKLLYCVISDLIGARGDI